MNALTIGLFALTAELLLAGLILWRRETRRRRRRQPGIEPVKDVYGERWPTGWAGIPEDPGDGDGTQ